MGDYITSRYGTTGKIIKIEHDPIYYFVLWDLSKGYSKYDQTTLEYNSELDIKRSRNETLSKILDK